MAEAPPESLTDSTRLITMGTLSSAKVIELIVFLEAEFNITLRDDDLAPERLDTIDDIVSLISELRRRPAASL